MLLSCLVDTRKFQEILCRNDTTSYTNGRDIQKKLKRMIFMRILMMQPPYYFTNISGMFWIWHQQKESESNSEQCDWYYNQRLVSLLMRKKVNCDILLGSLKNVISKIIYSAARQMFFWGMLKTYVETIRPFFHFEVLPLINPGETFFPTFRLFPS